MLTQIQKEAAKVAAIEFIKTDPTKDVRTYLQQWMLDNFAEAGRSEYWGEATEVLLMQEVIDFHTNALRESKVQAAFAKDKQDWLDTQDAGGNQDNPWVTFDSAERKSKLALRRYVIAKSNGGTGDETCPEAPIGYVEAHQLATAARDWLNSGKTEADAETLPSSDQVFYMRLAFKYLDLENKAISNGTFKTPTEVQRNIALAKFYANNP